MSKPRELQAYRGKDIPEVKLIPILSDIDNLITRTCEFFFKQGLSLSNSPFKGFLLEGPPGVGKTEIIKQATRTLDRRMGNVFGLFIDGASIAAPRWGDAEKALLNVFTYISKLQQDYNNPKVIIHFDDIECLMLTRGVDLAKEWHYSINSILFHELDKIDPSYVIVCATTNRPDLVDEALRDRLHSIEMPIIPMMQMKEVIEEILIQTGVSPEKRKPIVDKIILKLNDMDRPTLRDARQLTVIDCIENRVWVI